MRDVPAKVPEITLMFWVIKIAATTLGETAGDAASMTLNLGYLLSTAIFAAVFIVVAALQIRAMRFHAALYWLTIVATTTVGTTIADFCDRSLGVGYPGGVAILATLLALSLLCWRVVEGSVSVNRVATPRAESFYWVTILLSNTLGTALGDYVSDDGGFGFEGGAVLFSAMLLVLAGAYLWTRLSHVLLFWATFILTRPLGATLGDTLTKPVQDGGLHLGRIIATLVIAAFIVACVWLVPSRAGRHPEAPATG
jgi:uncharacterized membrane-anchored protein